MNPHIRYPQGYATYSQSYKLNPTSSYNNNNNSNDSSHVGNNAQNARPIYRKMSQQIINQSNDLLSRTNKSINKPYNNNSNLLPTMSYHLQSNNNPSTTTHYRTTHNFYRPNSSNNNQKVLQSANDFFNQVASQISNNTINNTNNKAAQSPHLQSIKMQRVTSQTYHNNQPILSSQQQPIQQQRIIYSSQQIQQKQPQNYQLISQDNNKQCQKCIQYQQQIQKLMKFMREQLQIGMKQYTDRMNKILYQQSKEIIDLRKLLINNEKNIINISQLSSTSCYNKSSKYSPSSKSQLKSKSPSKLSLTKSNTSSISPHHHHNHSTTSTHKQKITMVSKQLSPSKVVNNNHNNRHMTSTTTTTVIAQNISLSSTSSNMTIEQLSQKIKYLQQKVQIGYKIQNQRTQKIYVMNKRIQVLEKGLINVFGVKLQKIKQQLKSWLISKQQNMNSLYKQLKVISTRMGTLSTSSTIQQQSPYILNSHSSPLIPQPSTPQLQTSQKTLIKIKKFSSQLEDLRQHLTNLQTKQFKYDNYQLSSLSQQILVIKQRLSHLQKAKHHIANKLAQYQHKQNQKMLIVNGNNIQVSKYSNSNNNRNIQSSKPNSTSKIQSSKISSSSNNYNTMLVSSKLSNNNISNNSSKISQQNNHYCSSHNILQQFNNNNSSSHSSINNHNNNNISRSNNNSLLRNNSVQLTYTQQLNNNNNQSSLHDISTKSMNINNYYQQQKHYPSSHNHNKNYNQQPQFQQSFNHNGSSEQQQQYDNDSRQNQQYEDDMQQQQDEFFYPVDLSSGERQQVNSVVRVSASNRRMGNNNNMNNQYHNDQYHQEQQQQQYPSPTIHRFMQVIQYRKQIPLKIQIDQTGYIKSAQNGMYIVDRNMDGFDLNKHQLQWLNQRGIIIIEH